MIQSQRILYYSVYILATLFGMQVIAHAETKLKNRSHMTITRIKTSTPTTATNTKAVTPTQGVKWHPGHYIMLYSNQSEPYYFNSVLNDLIKYPEFNGVVKQYFWNKLETQYGVYDFSEIQSDLANLAKINKRLVLRIQAESFNTYDKRVPYYLQSSEYQGGVYPINTGKGYNAAYYNTKVQDRFISLVQALGNTFDKNPNLEIVNLEESSPSRNEPDWNATYITDYINGMLRVAVATKKAFPSTNVIQFFNYPETSLALIANTALTNGIGLGGPDTLQHSSSLITGEYSYYPKVTNIIPIAMGVDYGNYDSSYGSSSMLDHPSIASIHQFAVSALKPNYMFWLRRTAESNGSNHWQDVLNYFNRYNWQADPTSGINVTCPKTVNPCKSN